MKTRLKFSFYLSVLVVLSSYHSLNAQETARYKCAYQFDFLKDTIENIYFRQETYIVQIGDNITKGFTYHRFYLDSLKTHNPDLFNHLFNISINEAAAKWKSTGDISDMKNNSFSHGGFVEDLYKDYKKQEIRIVDLISSQLFTFKDELKPQNWIILSDTMTVLGYSCQKAVCHFRGRDYEAWFTPEIPISEGPWKFHGLPGLITKLHDSKKHYSFELTGFQEVNEKIDTKISKKAQKTERIEFIKTLMGKRREQMVQADLSKLGINNSDISPRQYDYIELDFNE